MNYWQGKAGPLLIAEIGGNHEGNFDYALRLTTLAIEADVDYIKYQIYTGDSLVNALESPDRNKHFKKFELTPQQHIQLAELCHKHNVGYMASVWDLEALDWIDPFMSVYKIGSGDLTAYDVIEKIATRQKPIIISTGLATKQEVLDVVQFLQSSSSFHASPQHVALLQCTSMYPINNSDAHLSVMQDLKEATNLTVGYSDHTEGSYAMEIAYAMGAEILEFHFTDTRKNQSFRDHKVSLTKQEVIDLKQRIQAIQQLKGNATKQPLKIETDHDHVTSFRRAIYPNQDIPAGTTIESQHLITLRPNHGIGAEEWHQLIGKTTKQPLHKLQKLDWSFFE